MKKMLLTVLASLMVLVVQAQDRTVTGKVVDDAGEALIGASIIIKGTAQGTITDANGSFTLTVSDDAVLVISYIGFVTREVTVGAQSVIEVQLEVDAEQLQEVVVVGYGTQKKADLTNSVAVMDVSGLDERPLARIDQALVGKMAGVRVKQTSGLPGRGFSIQVRGSSTITSNSEPLYVIDGFPLEVSNQESNGSFGNANPLSNINPNDIESIQVLKDAAATSIYGSRGSNGVVVITTKRGKPGKAKISFNSHWGIQRTVKKLDVLNSEEWIERAVETKNYNWVRDHATDLGATSSQTNDQRRALLGLAPGEYNTSYMGDDRWFLPNHAGIDYVDWQDIFFRDGFVQNYQLSATGGNEYVSYYVSGDYLDQEGIALGVNYSRYSARANVEVKANDKLTFGLNVSPSVGIINDPGVEGKDQITHILVGKEPVVESDVGAFGVNVGDNTRYAWGTSRVSPVAKAEERYAEQKIFRTLTTAYVEYELIENLRLKSSTNMDFMNGMDDYFSPSYVERNRTASGTHSEFNRTNFVQELTATYSKVFGDHGITVLGGYSYSTYKYADSEIRGTGFATDDVYTLNAATSITRGRTTERKNVLISYFGRANYDFKGKYLAQASIRRDGSSKFGDDTQWGIFPSFSAGWRLSEESFMSSLSMINDLKIRASWGKTGNTGSGDYDDIARLTGANTSFGGTLVNGTVPSNFANTELGWETAKTIDVGFDIGLFENRIYASFDYYNTTNEDLILEINVPSSSGFTEAITNIGEVLNKGVDLELNTVNLAGDLRWETSFNFGYNTNEVVHLGPNDSPILGGSFDINHNILEVGRPMYTLYVVQQDGLLTQADIDGGYPVYGNQEAGDPKYVDQNGDGVISPDDRTYSGQPNPKFVWGVNNTFRYKGFDLAILIQGQSGGNIYSTFGRGIYRTGMGEVENTLGKSRNRVRWVEGETIDAEDVAGKERKTMSSFGRIKNTDWQYPNDYWRIRNITLGYDLGRWIPNKYLNGARVYVTAENWFGDDKYEGGFNPEAVNNSGDDYGAFPLSRSLIFGMNLTF